MTLTSTLRACVVSRAGTTIRSPLVSCARPNEQTIRVSPIRALFRFMVFSLSDRLRVQADVAVQRVEGQLRPPLARARRRLAVAAVHKFSVAAVPSLRRPWQGGDVEIRIDAAIELLEFQVGVEPTLEVDVHRAVERLELRSLCRILTEGDFHLAVDRRDQPRSRHVLHLDSAVDPMDFVVAGSLLDEDVAIDRSEERR